VVLGFALLLIGNDRVQAAPVESVATFAEQVSADMAPSESNSPRNTGYVLLAVGGISLVAGLGFMLSSRSCA
jgi:hypothetical protein